jgi:hypothetical protein
VILTLTIGVFIVLISSPSFNSLSNNYGIYYHMAAAAKSGSDGSSVSDGGGKKSSPPDKKTDSSSSPSSSPLSSTAVPDNSNPTTITNGDKKKDDDSNNDNNNKDTTAILTITCTDGSKPSDNGKCKTQSQPHPNDDCLFNPSLSKCKSINEQCPRGFFLNDDDNCVPDKKCPRGFKNHAVMRQVHAILWK